MAAPVQLQAPNGVKWSQPTGLFINNEFVTATSGETLTSIDPAYVTAYVACLRNDRVLTFPFGIPSL